MRYHSLQSDLERFCGGPESGHCLPAEEAVRSCREEAAASQAGVDRLNRQLMVLATEISAAASEVQTIQLEMADQVASLELQSEQKQNTIEEERLAAQALADQLNEELTQNRECLERLRREAQEKSELHRKEDREYQRFEQELTSKYQNDRDQICQTREERGDGRRRRL